MTPHTSRRVFLAALTAVATSAPAAMPALAASEWPTAPVRIVVTFAPGGTSDIVARLLAQYMSEELGQQILVDNRPGAAGTVAADLVAKSAPDGLTLIMANNAPFTIAPTQFKQIPYDPTGDFTHIAYVGASAPGLMVQPSLGISDLAGYVEAARQGWMTFGSSGVGSISHILGEAVNGAADIKTVHVPYKGSAPAIQDFKAGVLKSYYDLIAQNMPMVKAGEAIAVAIAAPERIPQAPDVPTFREQGMDIVLENWLGISGPAGMDPAMVATIHDAFAAAVAKPEVQQRFQDWGIVSKTLTPAEYTGFVQDQIAVWAPLIIAAGAQEK